MSSKFVVRGSFFWLSPLDVKQKPRQMKQKRSDQLVNSSDCDDGRWHVVVAVIADEPVDELM